MDVLVEAFGTVVGAFGYDAAVGLVGSLEDSEGFDTVVLDDSEGFDTVDSKDSEGFDTVDSRAWPLEHQCTCLQTGMVE